MKKIYVTPEADVILISSSDILMLSLSENSTDGNTITWGDSGWTTGD